MWTYGIFDAQWLGGFKMQVPKKTLAKMVENKYLSITATYI